MFPTWAGRRNYGTIFLHSRKRGRTLKFTGLLLGMLMQAATCRAQNLAPDPGFESGDTSSWFPFGPATISAQTAQVHSGSYAGLVQNRTATCNGIAQSMQAIIQPG